MKNEKRIKSNQFNFYFRKYQLYSISLGCRRVAVFFSQEKSLFRFFSKFIAVNVCVNFLRFLDDLYEAKFNFFNPTPHPPIPIPILIPNKTKKLILIFFSCRIDFRF